MKINSVIKKELLAVTAAVIAGALITSTIIALILSCFNYKLRNESAELEARIAEMEAQIVVLREQLEIN